MKFDVVCDPSRDEDQLIEVGNVYGAKGGCGDTRYWVLACIRQRTAYCLGLDAQGKVVSTTSYGVHVFEVRSLLGRVPEFAELTLKIRWEK
jgi:hypothetical protein